LTTGLASAELGVSGRNGGWIVVFVLCAGCAFLLSSVSPQIGRRR